MLNRNTNLLEYLNNQPDFKGKIAAFSSWNIMPFIFNEHRSGFPVNSGYEMLDSPEEEGRLIDSVQEQVWQKNNTRHDQLTFLSAKEYIEKDIRGCCSWVWVKRTNVPITGDMICTFKRPLLLIK